MDSLEGISDKFVMLLFAGIGIYNPGKNTKYPLSQKYHDLVLRLASDGKLAYLISDDSICAGTNYPFESLLEGDNVMDKHSLGSFFSSLEELQDQDYQIKGLHIYQMQLQKELWNTKINVQIHVSFKRQLILIARLIKQWII